MNPALEEAGSTSDTRVKVKHKSGAWRGMPIIPGRVGRRIRSSRSSARYNEFEASLEDMRLSQKVTPFPNKINSRSNGNLSLTGISFSNFLPN